MGSTPERSTLPEAARATLAAEKNPVLTFTILGETKRPWRKDLSCARALNAFDSQLSKKIFRCRGGFGPRLPLYLNEERKPT